jgi:hypothetical protein
MIAPQGQTDLATIIGTIAGKRLRAQFPDLKIIVGLWGFKGELNAITRDTLLSAGADQVGTSLLQSRDQIGNLGHLISDSQTSPAPS